MEEDQVPCSSNLVMSVLRFGTAGAIWGLCVGPDDARKLGLTGIARASFVANSSRKFAFRCGFVALTLLDLGLGLVSGVFSITHCGLRKYRSDDWVNGMIAGAVAGAAVAAGTRSWRNVFGMAAVVSGICAIADYCRTRTYDESTDVSRDD